MCSKENDLIAVNEKGLRIGETHHRAKLTDHDIDLIRELYDEGLSYRQIALKFEVSRSHVRYIVKCRHRSQTPSRWKRAAERTKP